MSAASWAAALDALAQQLDQLDAELAAGAVELDFEPTPSGLGPLPEALRNRATLLQLRLVGVEAAVTEALERARQAMVLVGCMDDTGSRPQFLDARW